MTWTRSGAVLAAALVCCAKMSTLDEPADAGSVAPSVTAVDPAPGPVSGKAAFTVHFSAAMDEGVLLARTGRSETVALAAEADVERAAAAIEHSGLSAYERTLLVPAAAVVGSDRQTLMLTPDQPLPQGNYYLLLSPRLKDEQGRKFAATGARFSFQVTEPAVQARLLSPPAGGEAPLNLARVRAFAPAGRLTLVGPDGTAVASTDAQGESELALAGPLVAGARYALALDGVPSADQAFTAAACARNAPPAFEGGKVQIFARDTAVEMRVVLDWPAQVQVRVGPAAAGEPCNGGCVTETVDVHCSPPACGAQTFACALDLRLDGLDPAANYILRAVARDDLGFTSSVPLQRFSTTARLPRMIVSEVKVSPSDGEYAELLNLGPGAADLGELALIGPDGILRPLLATPPPLPVLLAPSLRALAVGTSFDASLYAALPAGTPVLRTSTQRLLGRGLSDDAPPAFRLVVQGEVPVELSDFPGFSQHCTTGASFQRDEAVAPDSQATWRCGSVGGTPGAPP